MKFYWVYYFKTEIKTFEERVLSLDYYNALDNLRDSMCIMEGLSRVDYSFSRNELVLGYSYLSIGPFRTADGCYNACRHLEGQVIMGEPKDRYRPKKWMNKYISGGKNDIQRSI